MCVCVCMYVFPRGYHHNGVVAHDVKLNPSYAHLAASHLALRIVYILSYWYNIAGISVNRFWKVQFISRKKLKRPIFNRN